jgi:hypothetical protein
VNRVNAEGRVDFLGLREDIRRWQQALKAEQERWERDGPFFVAMVVFLERCR